MSLFVAILSFFAVLRVDLYKLMSQIGKNQLGALLRMDSLLWRAIRTIQCFGALRRSDN